VTTLPTLVDSILPPQIYRLMKILNSRLLGESFSSLLVTGVPVERIEA
jgi:hypothetical protein